MSNDKDIVQQAIDYDVAIEMIAKLRSDAIRRKQAATTVEERQAADAEIKAYNVDESVLNGYGTDEDRTAVYRKLFRANEPKQRKIIFLDFDGVMVTDRNQQPLQDEYGAVFDPACVERLKQIINSTGADIVVTSTWKIDLGAGGIRMMWTDRHLPGKFIGVTPNINPIHRGEEISVWLTAHGNDCRYAIIDDCPFSDFFREEQLSHLFRVDERIGLDEDTAREVIGYLNGHA